MKWLDDERVRALLWTIAWFLSVTSVTCGPVSEKPIVAPNPDFANCEAKKDQRENECLIEAGTRAQFDDCIARVRKSCVDGGVK